MSTVPRVYVFAGEQMFCTDKEGKIHLAEKVTREQLAEALLYAFEEVDRERERCEQYIRVQKALGSYPY